MQIVMHSLVFLSSSNKCFLRFKFSVVKYLPNHSLIIPKFVFFESTPGTKFKQYSWITMAHSNATITSCAANRTYSFNAQDCGPLLQWDTVALIRLELNLLISYSSYCYNRKFLEGWSVVFLLTVFSPVVVYLFYQCFMVLCLLCFKPLFFAPDFHYT